MSACLKRYLPQNEMLSRSPGRNIGRLLLMLAFLKCVSMVIIMERSTGGFLRSRGVGPLELVRGVEKGTVFKFEYTDDPFDPLSFVIRELGGQNAFEYLDNGDELMLAPFDNATAQKFSLALDSDGYVQIVQGGTKFLYYDHTRDTFMGGSYLDDREQGFILHHDNGRSCYPPEYGKKERIFGSAVRFTESRWVAV